MRRSRWLAIAMAGALVASQVAGCTAMRLTGANLALLFRTPDAPPAQVVEVAAHGARITATWIGHATVLLQLDDKFVLTDPIFTEYAGSVTRRLVAPALTVDRLPPLAAVLVSHRHVDHLSPASLKAIGGKAATVLVPPGAAGDIPAGPYKVRELARWESEEEDGLRITAVPVDHNGGRFFDRKKHPLAFTGYVIEYRGLTVYFPGDTAFAPELFRETAERFPRIDLALLPIGPIEPHATTHRNHENPAEALEAARLLGAAEMMPIHYDTFVHSFDAPGDCLAALRKAMAEDGSYPAERVHVLRIGERLAMPAVGALEGAQARRSSPAAPASAQGAP
jgi:L-ascorbate metabolism protein UlaG (beta-lactamase superfamily)